MTIKLTDFCYAVEQEEDRFTRRNSDVGLIEYKCPEFFKSKGYGFEFDEWCFGIIFFKLLTGVFPFKGKNEDDVKKAVLEAKLSFPDSI